MKAKEYAEKYKELANPALDNDRFVELMRALTKEMLDELVKTITTRHIKTESALKAAERELNVKGNKISELLNNPLKPDWFSKILDLVAGGRFE